MAGDDSRSRSEVVALLCLRKNVWNIVTLIAPGVHVNRREENSESGVKHNSMLRQVVRDSNARSKIQLICVVKTFRKPLLPADENCRYSILKREVRIRISNINQRTHEFVT